MLKSFLAATKCCGQGNIFTPVCHFVHGGGSASMHAGMPPPWDQADPPGSDTPLDLADPPRYLADPPWVLPQCMQGTTPPRSRLQHTVYERPVGILLEGILVKNY